MRDLIRTGFLGWALLGWGATGALLAAGERPNIILVLTDDQGYGDIGFHGNPIIQTPNLDRLAAESVRLTSFHVSPTCAPSRAAMLSGRHEFHSGVTHTIQERERMSLRTTTYAQVLKAAGYATGIFGKWHLGDDAPRQPEHRGFDEVFIHGCGGIGQAYPGTCADAPGNRYFDPAILHNGRFEKVRGYCTDAFFAQALTWIEAKKDDGPFYAHIATNAPHVPLDCPEEYARIYNGKVPENVAKFYGMITNIDENVGKLLAKLGEWGIERKTLVIFQTDNGGTAGVGTFNAGMRAAKGTPYEGGTRVPSFWRWPGTLEPGVRPQLTAHIDLFPTFAELAGAMVPPDVAAKLEGRSLWPLLKQATAPWPDRELFTHVGRWPRGQAAHSQYAKCAVRTNRYHLVSMAAGPTPAWELFDLWNDPGEHVNVADRNPEVVQGLARAYDAWWRSVLPDLDNEDAPVPATHPYHELYWRQFPSERPKD